MFEIPKNINIGGLDYKVKLVDELKQDNQEYTGIIDHYKGEILLDSKTLERPEALEVTFWHEVFHRIFRSCGVHEEHDEKLMDMLAWGMFRLLKDNPDLLKTHKNENIEIIHDQKDNRYELITNFSEKEIIVSAKNGDVISKITGKFKNPVEFLETISNQLEEFDTMLINKDLESLNLELPALITAVKLWLIENK